MYKQYNQYKQYYLDSDVKKNVNFGANNMNHGVVVPYYVKHYQQFSLIIGSHKHWKLNLVIQLL